LSIHEIDEEDDEWLFRRKIQAQAGRGDNNNNNNNIIIRDNAEINNNASQHNANNSHGDIVGNRNNTTNDNRQNDMSIRQAPDIRNDQNNERIIRQEQPVKQATRGKDDRSYKPYSKSYTNFRTEPVMTRSAARAEAQRRLEPIVERVENEEIRHNAIREGDVRTSTPRKEVEGSFSPVKKNKEVSFKARDTILPYSPIAIPSSSKETGTRPKSYTNEGGKSPSRKKCEEPVLKNLTAKDLYIPPFRRDDGKQADTSHRSKEMPRTRRSSCSEREMNALLDLDMHRSRHSVSFAPNTSVAETKVKDNKFIIKFPQFRM